MFPFNCSHNACSHVIGRSSWILFSLLLVGCSGSSSNTPASPSVVSTGTPGAEVAVGERLFLETRFAQAFKVFVDNGGNVNDPIAGDPVMDIVETTTPGAPIDPGPFKSQTINCRACHR